MSGRHPPLWKVAVQSIAWGYRPLEEIFSQVREAGFGGIELFQHPKEVGGALAVENGCRAHGLELIGVTCGSFVERCQLVRDIAKLRHVHPSYPTLPYVYVDEWREDNPLFPQTVEEGIRVAIHPHMYKPV